MAEKNSRVCVTGAGGYIASWLIKLLLSDGYTVHGTVRDPKDDKNAHLKKLENAAEKLKLFKGDLLDFDSILAAVKGCEGIFHVASPVPPSCVQNPEVELVAPALQGTINVLKACSEAKVKNVVIVSSAYALIWNPNWPKDRVVDESCWSDKEYCRTRNDWYSYSKTVAEEEAWEYAKRNGLNMVTVSPTLVLGPMLQHTLNTSSLGLVKLLREGYEDIENYLYKIVDVRDVAEGLKLVYEKPEAEGRYICMSHMIRARDLIQILREIYPNYNYPKRFLLVSPEKCIGTTPNEVRGFCCRILLRPNHRNSPPGFEKLQKLPIVAEIFCMGLHLSCMDYACLQVQRGKRSSKNEFRKDSESWLEIQAVERNPRGFCGVLQTERHPTFMSLKPSSLLP